MVGVWADQWLSVVSSQRPPTGHSAIVSISRDAQHSVLSAAWMDLMDLRICGPTSLSLTAVVHCAANAVSVSYRFAPMASLPCPGMLAMFRGE